MLLAPVRCAALLRFRLPHPAICFETSARRNLREYVDNANWRCLQKSLILKTGNRVDGRAGKRDSQLGYARASYTILPKLTEALQPRSNKIPTIDQAQPCIHSKADSVSEAAHVSKHGRTFKYQETKQAAPAITIRHLWLKRPD